MPKPKYHVFICNGTKLSGQQCGICRQKGGEAIYKKFIEVLTELNINNDVFVNSCDCFRCKITKKGPNMVVYPEGIWYGGVSVDDVENLITSHFVNGQVVEKLVLL